MACLIKLCLIHYMLSAGAQFVLENVSESIATIANHQPSMHAVQLNSYLFVLNTALSPGLFKPCKGSATMTVILFI